MEQEKLNQLLDEIDKSGIADSLITRLAKEFELTEDDTKYSLKSII